MRRRWSWLALGWVGCAGSELPTAPEDSDADSPLPCPVFGPPDALGAVPSPPATELSGIVVDANGAWVHNDSGPETLHRIGFDGATMGAATTGTTGRDMEDLARLPDGRLVLADIGDNGAARADVAFVTFTVDGTDVSEFTRRTLAYANGPRDAETLLADDAGTLWVVEKAVDGASGVYEAVGSVLERRTVLQFGTAPLGRATLVTGGDLGPRGIVLRTYLDEAYVWPRTPGEPVEVTFGRDPCPVTIAGEPQGEAIGWGPDGLYTVSEGETPTLYRIPFDESLQ